MKPIEILLNETLPDMLKRHAAFDEQRNPVLTRIKPKPVVAQDVAKALGQYSLLPATIVEFLKIGESRLFEWEAVREELQRNIGEEMGSRTEGQTHYEILKTSANRELGLLLSDAAPTPDTDKFLNQIRQDLFVRPRSHAAGMLFALEASAIPELTVVAHVVNKYAELIGNVENPITLSEHDWKNTRGPVSHYTLNSFFAAHLFDFEVGHRNRLANTLEKYIQTSREMIGFQQGYESVLCIMDQWWENLAAEICGIDRSPVTCVPTWVTNPLSRHFLMKPEVSL
ncbi:MAG TPA: DUF3865 domain-containing protein [Pyrinomonadaceae bacterium]